METGTAQRGVRKVVYERGAFRETDGVVPQEEEFILTVNGQDLVGLMCTPTLLEELALGFLYNEGLIDGLDDVASLRLCEAGRAVDIWLRRSVELPSLHTITSGCSGGMTFEALHQRREPLQSALTVTPDQVLTLARRLQEAAVLYRQTRGIHAAALARGTELLFVAEDVGRHNTVDKLAGLCLRRGHPMADAILIATGRISSEMLIKAVRMRVPIVISFSSPTSRSVDLAQAWNITLIGYARGQTFQVYAGAGRIVPCCGTTACSCPTTLCSESGLWKSSSP
ncbi:MAG: formate dehydrogenase accessory sulfurtransferase FdhD [Anaerolineae bacterium]|nr:formate dehydrogenase accessory sulfurtransferase FdhD [Anaerolineae bacterium]MCX8066674.1 formate dehydrogenase accessory sulfurtransferase FdhD [Anaerolineae bacterium]MDW7992678.1 formate dehydrogenase accessory sulfurtransferase FdhD [Anaerolineae bacterium]